MRVQQDVHEYLVEVEGMLSRDSLARREVDMVMEPSIRYDFYPSMSRSNFFGGLNHAFGMKTYIAMNITTRTENGFNRDNFILLIKYNK